MYIGIDMSKSCTPCLLTFDHPTSETRTNALFVVKLHPLHVCEKR